MQQSKIVEDRCLIFRLLYVVCLQHFPCVAALCRCNLSIAQLCKMGKNGHIASQSGVKLALLIRALCRYIAVTLAYTVEMC